MSTTDHVKALTELRETREQLPAQTRAAVHAAHADGMSGAQIAKHLGISRQAVNRIYLPKAKRRGTAGGLAAALTVIAALGLTACGGSTNAPTTTPATIASQLPRQYAAKGKLAHVVCVKRSASEYRCEGDFTPTRATVEASMKGIDTSEFVDDDWAALIAQNSGPLAVDVVVDTDGSWVATPVAS